MGAGDSPRSHVCFSNDAGVALYAANLASEPSS
jgi:hypothetical protein